MKSLRKKECPVCRATVSKAYRTVYDDRYGYSGLFSLLQCPACLHLSLNTAFSQDEISTLYSHFYPRSQFNLSEFKPLKVRKGFRSWLEGVRAHPFSRIPKQVKILDIGCGFGESLAYHKERGCEAHGVEVDDNILRVAEKFGFNVKCGQFNADNYQKNYFDYITMEQVIEHVSDPVQTLRDIASILKPEGTVVFSTPNPYGWSAFLFEKKWMNWHTPYHYHLFSKKSLCLAAQKAGFAVSKIRTITPSIWIYFQLIHFFTWPRQGTPSAYWSQKPQASWSPGLKFLNSLLWLFYRLKMYHIFTRLFDGLGIGDNYVVVLKVKH
jgi:2-polyprenyl-3-methyl-5-hydroxy-6-metoxy-1,4-benzoquinol methylase